MIAELFDGQGHVGRDIALPQNSILGWDGKTGDPFVMEIIRRQGEKPKRNFYSVDISTGNLTAMTTVPAPDSTPELQQMTVNAAAGLALYEAKPGVKSKEFEGTAKTIWLRVEGGTSDMAGVVTTDGEQGNISPKGDAVMYRSKGSAYVRRLFKVSPEAYAMYRKRAAQRLAMDHAKQTALAFLMMANDANDMLPNASSSWQSMLGPYLGDSSISAGFNYLFAGGSMTSVDNPANTILGFISGPDGRAVAYIDGHVKWISN